MLSCVVMNHRSRPRPSAVLLILGVLVALGLLVRWLHTPPPLPVIPGYNVLYINADSFNRAHTPFHGYQRNTMPFTAELAKEGVVMDGMINPSGWTNENLASIFSGLSSPIHGVETRMRNVHARWFTPIEMLREHGYRAPRLQGWQMDQNHAELGFEGLEALHPAEWIERHGREGRFFLFHQFLGPHLPYNGDRRETEILATFFPSMGYRDAAQRRRMESTILKHTVIVNDGTITFRPEDTVPVHAFYDGELLLLDREIERAVRALERAGLRESTIIVVSADHGEELLEHGFVGHASTSRHAQLFDEIVRVPFLIVFPRALPAGRRVATQVRGIDIMPTVLELLGLETPDYLEGRSFLPVIEGRETADRPAFIQTSRAGYGEPDPDSVVDRIHAVRADGWKFLHYNYQEHRERYELYDLANDPGERENVLAAHPEIAARLQGMLEEWRERCATWPAPDPASLERRSPWQRLKAWLFGRPVRTDFTGVPSPPVIVTPRDSVVISVATDNGRAVIGWTGEPDVPYVIGYDAGLAEYHITGEIPVIGNEKIYGPFPAIYWNTYLTLFSPYKVRVSIDKQPREWSPWLHFEVKAADAP